MDKTYSETRGVAPFDWNLALEKPPQMDSPRAYALGYKAREWVTCACGNQCAIIPRDDVGGPLDMELAQLGCDFYREVMNWKWGHAKLTLAKIEVRSKILIAEELAKLNANP